MGSSQALILNRDSLYFKLQQPVHQPFRRLGDHCSGRENFGGAGIQNRVIVLRRDDAAGDDQNVLPAELVQRVLQLGDKRQVAGCER